MARVLLGAAPAFLGGVVVGIFMAPTDAAGGPVATAPAIAAGSSPLPWRHPPPPLRPVPPPTARGLSHKSVHPPPGGTGPTTTARARSAPPASVPLPAQHYPTSPTGWTGPWACIAEYESGGNPAEDTGNGYYGGLQFSMSTWAAYGGSGNPAAASIPEQEAVAARVLAGQGWAAWPQTSRRCGL